MISSIIRFISNVVLTFLSFFSGKHFPAPPANRTPPTAENFPQFFQNADRLWLHWHEWWPADIPRREVKGILFLSSGLGEHGTRYDGVAMEWARKGDLAVFSLDHQGHGLSEGDRKHVERFENYFVDYVVFLQRVYERYPFLVPVPRFLLGHSMGGLIALNVQRRCLERPPTLPGVAKEPFRFDGLILSAPATRVDPALASPPIVAVGSLLSRLVPKLPVSSIPDWTICRSPSVVLRAARDPLFTSAPVRARWANELILTIQKLWKNVPAFTTSPLLIIHGDKDMIVPVAASQDLFKAAGTADKRILVFPGAFHEILFDDDLGPQSRSDVLAFIQKHL